MMENLRDYLKRYRDVTEGLLKCVRSENFDKLEALVERRQELIEGMRNMSHINDEFKSICREYQIISLQEELNTAMIEKLKNTKHELKRISVGRKMNNSYYNNRSHVDSLYLSKKI